jgi:tetratricopeptide (TPR) repeat protein
MLTDNEYKTIKREAGERLRAGDMAGSIEIQVRLVEQLMAGGPQAAQAQPGLADQLERAAGELVDALRWNRQYEPAIDLQERLVAFLPGSSQALRLGAANLRVEAGQAEEGLAQLQALAETDADNFWYPLSLALAFLYLERLDEAEPVLRRAAGMAHVRKIDRALAQQYLFKLYDHQGKTEEALAAWREASRLDQSLRGDLLPAVCRMLIYWHAFSEASRHLGMEGNPARRQFYRGLLLHALRQPGEAVEAWREVTTATDLARLKEGQDEYAEACVRLGAPEGAITALGPLVDAGQPGYIRMVLLGLAWAQRRDLSRARWFLEAALRLGDLERPRRTMPAPQGRILDIHARLLYAESPLDPGVRRGLERYFTPEKEKDAP